MKSKTYYQLILDASGSMSNVRSETLNAVNNQILSIRSLSERMPGQEMVVSLVLFNTEVTTLYSHLAPEQAPLLTLRQYVPEGSTALLDAIGMRIMDTERLLSPEDDVVIVVLTDGEENASQFFTYKQIAEKISNRKRTERWSFSFVGADIDAWSIARRLNIDREEVRSVSKSHLANAMQEMNVTLHDYMDHKRRGMRKTGFFKN